MMNEIRVEGRHLGNTTAVFRPENIVVEPSCYADGVVLRLDDKENLAWWLSIDIPLAKLEELVAQAKKEEEQ